MVRRKANEEQNLRRLLLQLELSGLNNPIDKLLKSIRMLDEESQQNEKAGIE